MNPFPLVLSSLLAFVAALPAQDPAAALARAQLLERQEGDLRAAEAAYRAVLADPAAKAVHAAAALRLGALLWRLERRDDARPLLEQAVAAGGELAAEANAVLQGQGDAASTAAARLLRARALVSRLEDLVGPSPTIRNEATGRAIDDAARDLRWLGEAAATAVVERLSDWLSLDERQLQLPDGSDLPQAAALIRLFWQIGTPPARAFAASAAVAPSIGFRRMMTRHVPHDPAPDMPAMAVLFLREAGPTGEVGRNLDALVQRLSLEQLAALAEEQAAAARGAAFRALAGRWRLLDGSDRERVYPRLAPRLQQGLQAVEPDTARGAWWFAIVLGGRGPVAGRRLLLAALPNVPSDIHPGDSAAVALEDADLALLMAAARSDNPQVQAHVRWWLENHEPQWTEASVDAVLELLERGFASERQGNPKWGGRLLATASDEQLVRLLRALPRVGNPDLVLEPLSDGESPTAVPVVAAGALRDLIDRCLADPPRYWDVYQEQVLVSGGPRVRAAGGTTLRLLRLLGRCPDPVTAAWLMRHLERSPALVNTLAETAVLLSLAGIAEAAVPLRAMLVWPGTPEVAVNTQLRSLLFAELARVGDRSSIEMFPQAFGLGLARVRPYIVGGSTRAQGGRVRRGSLPTLRHHEWLEASGIGFLALVRERSGAIVPWHGYDQESLLATWRSLLDGPAADAVWSQLRSLPSESVLPLPVLPLLAERLPAVWANADANQQGVMQNSVLRAFEQVDKAAVAADPTLQPAVARLLRGDPRLGIRVLLRLEPAVARESFAPEALHLLRSNTDWPDLGPWTRANIPFERGDWEVLLQSSPSRQISALAALPAPLDPMLRPQVEALLRSGEANVRAAACQALARLCATDSVGVLLETLNDPHDMVRKAATEALEQIRFQQEQRSYWATAGSGIDASPAAALAKLLAQARAGEPKEQRVLAIRSLAALGRAEALPFLIDAGKDSDVEVASAARAALATIHERAGVAK